MAIENRIMNSGEFTTPCIVWSTKACKATDTRFCIPFCFMVSLPCTNVLTASKATPVFRPLHPVWWVAHSFRRRRPGFSFRRLLFWDNVIGKHAERCVAFRFSSCQWKVSFLSTHSHAKSSSTVPQVLTGSVVEAFWIHDSKERNEKLSLGIAVRYF